MGKMMETTMKRKTLFADCSLIQGLITVSKPFSKTGKGQGSLNFYYGPKLLSRRNKTSSLYEVPGEFSFKTSAIAEWVISSVIVHCLNGLLFLYELL